MLCSSGTLRWWYQKFWHMFPVHPYKDVWRDPFSEHIVAPGQKATTLCLRKSIRWNTGKWLETIINVSTIKTKMIQQWSITFQDIVDGQHPVFFATLFNGWKHSKLPSVQVLLAGCRRWTACVSMWCVCLCSLLWMVAIHQLYTYILVSYLLLYKHECFLVFWFPKTKGCFEPRQIQLCFQFMMDCRQNHPKTRFAHSGHYKRIVPPCDPGWGGFDHVCVWSQKRWFATLWRKKSIDFFVEGRSCHKLEINCTGTTLKHWLWLHHKTNLTIAYHFFSPFSHPSIIKRFGMAAHRATFPSTQGPWCPTLDGWIGLATGSCQSVRGGSNKNQRKSIGLVGFNRKWVS